MPAHHEIEETIDEYLSKVSIDDKQALFQSVNKAGTALTGRALNRYNALGSHSQTSAERGFSDAGRVSHLARAFLFENRVSARIAERASIAAASLTGQFEHFSCRHPKFPPALPLHPIAARLTVCLLSQPRVDFSFFHFCDSFSALCAADTGEQLRKKSSRGCITSRSQSRRICRSVTTLRRVRRSWRFASTRKVSNVRSTPCSGD
jgi:hypothetical protein